MVVNCPACGAQNRLPPARLGERARCGSCKQALTPLGAPLELANAQEFRELTGQSPLPVLVDFWAPWCGPCRMVAPELKKLAERHAGRLVVAKVNTDELPQVAAPLGISGIPTLILFRHGDEARRVSGAMPAAALERELGL